MKGRSGRAGKAPRVVAVQCELRGIRIMRTITVDNKLLEVLARATSLAEVCDSSGTLVCFFAPASLEHADLYARAAAQISPQEIRRRAEAGGKTYTTQEVLEHLRSLEKS